MHAEITIGEDTLMLSDGMTSEGPAFKGFSITLEATDAAHADRMFRALGDGGQVQMPIGKTFFSPYFGVVADRFGLSWMIMVRGDRQG